MNSIYKVVWCESRGTWVVASELAKGHVRSKKSQNNKKGHKQRDRLLKGMLSLALIFGGSAAFAASCDVGTSQALRDAFSSGCTEINLTEDITLSSNINNNNLSDNIVINGNGKKLTMGVYQFNATTTRGSSEEYNITFEDFGDISSGGNNNNANNVIIHTDRDSHINVIFNNTALPDNSIAWLTSSSGSTANIQNVNSWLTFGNITKPVNIQATTFKQLANLSKVRFAGNMEINGLRGGSSTFAYIFWSNTNVLDRDGNIQNIIEFTKDANVKMNLDQVKFTTGDGSGQAFAYFLEDGAQFQLWGSQNVFGNTQNQKTNAGFILGSFDKNTQSFGEGVVLKVGGYNNSQLIGNGVSNLSSVVGYDFGADGKDDVIFNLAQGSEFNVSGTGIVAEKNVGNASNIYIRSGTNIMGENGIRVRHDGTGDVVIANDGVITTSQSGIRLLSNNHRKVNLDLTGGTINATGGAAIVTGDGTTGTDVELKISGGTINLTNGAVGIDVSTAKGNSHTITDTILNINKTAEGGAATGKLVDLGRDETTGSKNLTLTDVEMNVGSGHGFDVEDLSRITFENTKGGNLQLNVTGDGAAFVATGSLAGLGGLELDINVNSSDAIGIRVTGGSEDLVYTDDIKLNVIEGTALQVENGNRTLINEGTIQGAIKFVGASNGGNTITNQGTIEGSLSVEGNSTTLNLADNSTLKGSATLGNGENTVNIGNGAYVEGVTTGSGNDTFKITDFDSASGAYLGRLDAGAGNDTLDITRSTVEMSEDSIFENFNNIILQDNSSLGLVKADPSLNGEISLDGTSTLVFRDGYNGEFVATLLGNGSAIITVDNGADVTLTEASSSYQGSWDIATNGTITVTAQNALGTGAMVLEGTLNLQDYTTFINALTGSGHLVLNDGGNFTFAESVGENFAGSIELNNTQLNLAAGSNSTVLTQATIIISKDGQVTFGDDLQTLKGLVLNGGTLVVTSHDNGSEVGRIQVENSADDKTTVTVNIADIKDEIGKATLAQMLGGETFIERLLESSEDITDKAGNILSEAQLRDLLILKDINNESITKDTNISQGGEDVATGHYEVVFNGTAGLNLIASLLSLEILDGKDLTLDSTIGTDVGGITGPDIDVKLTGSGGITVITDEAPGLVFNNGENDYTGTTTVQDGKLSAGADGALGNTSELIVKEDGIFDGKGTDQTVGKLTNDGRFDVDAAGSGSGKFDVLGDIENSGDLDVNGGILTAGGNVLNKGKGNIELGEGGELLAEGDITNEINAELDVNGGQLIGNNIINAGEIDAKGGNILANGDITNSGEITLGGNGSLTGEKFTNSGEIDLGADNGTLIIKNGGSSTKEGGLKGTGSIIVEGGKDDNAFVVSGSNSELDADIYIEEKGEVTLVDSGTLGSGNIIIAEDGDLNLAGDQIHSNSISGTGNVNTTAKVTLEGDNSKFSGDHNINENGELTVTNKNGLGDTSNINLNDATSGLILSGVEAEISNVITGVENSTITVSNGSEVFFIGNDETAGKAESNFIVSGDSSMTVSDEYNLGTGSVTLEDEGSNITLDHFASGEQTELANTVSGEGSLVLKNGTDLTIADDNERLKDLVGGVTITGGVNGNSSLTVDSGVGKSEADGSNFNDNLSFNLEGEGNTLTVNSDVFDRNLKGNGSIVINGTKGTEFEFGANRNTGFEGKVDLNSGDFTIAGNNTVFIKDSEFTANGGGTITVGDGTTTEESVKKVTINDGTIIFDAALGNSTAETILKTDELTFGEGGKISIAGGNGGGTIKDSNSILEQADGDGLLQLVDGEITAGNVTNLDLEINGSYDNPVVSEITQNGNHVANATYDYGLTDEGANGEKGLYVKYGLSGLNLITDGDDALKLKTEDGIKNILDTKLSGIGGIFIDGVENGPLTLTNKRNEYTGKTTVNSGGLKLGEDHVLGQDDSHTSELIIREEAYVDVNGKTQTIGKLTNDGELLLNEGNLTITEGGTSTAEGGLVGGGNLNIAGGDLTVSAGNDELTGNLNIDDGSSVTLTKEGSLGDSKITIAEMGDLNLNGESVSDPLLDPKNNTVHNNEIAGSGNVNISGKIELSGDNSEFSGDHNVNGDGRLTVKKAENLGEQSTVNLREDGSELVFSGVTDDIGNSIKGGDGSIVTVQDEADFNLTGDNSEFRGEFSIQDSSNMAVSKRESLGEGSVDLASPDSSLTLKNYEGGENSELANRVSGSGSLTLSDGTDLNILDDKVAGLTGKINITETSTLNINSESQFSDDLTFNIAENGDVLNLQADEDYTFNQTLEGSGTFAVDSLGVPNNGIFSFTDQKGAAQGALFNGTLDLTNTNFELNKNNANALVNANLSLSKGSYTTVVDGQESIHQLTMNEGTLSFGNIIDTDGKLSSAGTIKTEILDVTGAGNIKTHSGDVEINLPDMTPNIQGKTVLQLDEGEKLITLIESDEVKGSAGSLQLVDHNGEIISKGEQQNLLNSETGTLAAIGTFDYRLSVGEERDGLYVVYGLTEVDLIGQGDDALELEGRKENNHKGSNDLSAKVTGAGDLMIKGDEGSIISLSNKDNSYTGVTDVRSGTLQLLANNALGKTSELKLGAGTGIDFTDTQQVVGELNSALGSLLMLGAGSLVEITKGGEVSGNITGSGSMSLSGGNLVVNSANQTFTGTVDITEESKLSLSHISGIGSSDVTVDGALDWNSVKGLMNNALTGTGTVNFSGSEVQFGKDNAGFTGNMVLDATSKVTATSITQLGTGTTISNDGEMTLWLADNETLDSSITGSGDFVKNGAGSLSVTEGLNYTGTTAIKGGTLFLDSSTLGGEEAGSVTIDAGAMLAGQGIVSGKFYNFGTLKVTNSLIENSEEESSRKTISEEQEFASLTLNKDLVNSGVVRVGQEKLVGNSLIIKGNYQGLEGATIYMNTALGNNTTSLTDNIRIEGRADGTTLLHINNVGGTGAQTTGSGVKIVDVGTSTVDAFKLANIVVSGSNEYSLIRDSQDQDWYLKSEDMTRPDSGNNLANIDAIIKSQIPGYGGQTMGSSFGGSGGLRAISKQGLTEEQSTTFWNITTGADGKGHTGNKQVKYEYETYSTLFGLDKTFERDGSLWTVGGMAGYSQSHTSGKNRWTGSDGSGRVKGTIFGIYGIWQIDANNVLSPFVEGNISYGHYRNEVWTQGNDKSKYNANLWSFTLQGGYPILVAENIVIEPQAQFTYLHYSGKDYVDHSDTRISQKLDGKAVGRVGAYIYSMQGDLKPYAAVNLWYDGSKSSVSYNNEVISSGTKGLLGEIKAGLDFRVDKDMTISGEVNYRKGKDSYRDYSVNVGLQYNF